MYQVKTNYRILECTGGSLGSQQLNLRAERTGEGTVSSVRATLDDSILNTGRSVDGGSDLEQNLESLAFDLISEIKLVDRACVSAYMSFRTEKSDV